MEEINVESIWVDTKEELVPYEKLYEDIYEEYENNKGFIYVKITKGQKAGSICKLVSEFQPELCIYDQGDNYHAYVSYSGELRWDGRKNKPQEDFWVPHVVWLKGYNGPTIYKASSPKEEKEKASKKPVFDIDGKELSIGDNVVYINTRYGNGSKLCHGKILRFDLVYSANRNFVTKYTIVQLKDNTEESKILNPKEYIYKL